MSVGVVVTVFVLIGLAELPDKTMIANLVLGSRNRPLFVWLGSAGAFAVHVGIAVGAGRAIELLPHEALEIVVTGLFFFGALALLLLPQHKEEAHGEKLAGSAKPAAGTPWKIAGAAFGVTLVGEFGDLTQLLVVDFVGKYHEPWAVAVGAFGGLLAASAAGAFGGRALLRLMPLEWIRRAGALALLGFAAYGVYSLVA